MPQRRTRIFWHKWGGGDPIILYNITGYGLTGLFFEIQTKTRFPINFNWEISVAWVRTYLTRAKFGLGKKVWTLLFLEKNPDLFPQPKFCLCKVRTHATEISQLKLMGNLVFVCISKNKPVNPYPVILYKIVGSPPPHLCQKIQVRHCGRIGRPWHASGNPPTKINGKYSFWPILCN